MRREKTKKTVFIIAGCILITLLLALVIWSLMFLGTTDIKKYGQFENYNGYSKLEIFPEEIPEDAQDVSYYYLNRDTFMDPTCEVYLKCTYSEETYKDELERLKAISGIKEDAEHFMSTTYVSVYNFSSSYEYALPIEAENTIVYISTQGIYPSKLLGLKFDKKYLPNDFMKDTTYVGDSRNFSIYY